jgi:hypothetical protein
MIARSARLAEGLLRPEDLRYGALLDRIGTRGELPTLRMLAQLIHFRDRAPATLGLNILQSLRQLVPATSAEGGRLMGTIALYGYESGAYDLRAAMARQVVRLAYTLRDDHLQFLGWITLAGDAYMRGNLPRLERRAMRSLRLARRSGDVRAEGVAMTYSGIAAGMRGDHARATELLWKAYKADDHPRLRQTTLSNLGESLYLAGHFRESRAARAASFQYEQEPNSMCVAIGGYAVCSSALGDVAGVQWAVDQLLSIAGTYRESRGVAQGFLGCADACGEVGLLDLSRTLYQRGREIADRQGFHDLQFRADPAVRPASRTTVPFAGEAEEARASIRKMAPNGIALDSVLVPA